ncbi:hypothetical protein [Dactylosporangium salmoneum]|uniref:hypothetical protein n=1 Tax=Dactylosporangium salmoneum TaxID=53361 RepID=UPI0031CE35B2
MLNATVRECAVPRNPGQIQGASSDLAKERPVAAPAEVAALVDAITPPYCAAVLLAPWCGAPPR